MPNTTPAPEATDAELIAAIHRGIAAGTIIEATPELLAQWAADAEAEAAAEEDLVGQRVIELGSAKGRGTIVEVSVQMGVDRAFVQWDNATAGVLDSRPVDYLTVMRPAAEQPLPARVPLGDEAQLAYAKFLAGLPCHECGASGDQVCAPTCGAGLSAEEKGSYPC